MKPRQTLGKYRIKRRLAEGGFATVYRARDLVEGVDVALKIPHEAIIAAGGLDVMRREIRVNVALEHPNILPLKNAMEVDGRFVIAYPLGQESLGDRLRRRLSAAKAMRYGEQLLEALAAAHAQRVVHCDVKPDNVILFENDRIRLGDFGIAKIAYRTRSLVASGAGTVGYMAPEQAFGKPSFRSDVFSAGLVMYRMLTGELPGWPFDWPPPGIQRLKATTSAEFVEWLRRSIQLDHRKRFSDAGQMLAAFKKVRRKALKKSAPVPRTPQPSSVTQTRWPTVRTAEFQRSAGKWLEARGSCAECRSPIAEAMTHCPWCGVKAKEYTGPTRAPLRCDRCGRGVKADFRYCGYCYGPGFEPSGRPSADKRYEKSCPNAACPRGELLPFMRYCPWCRRKVRDPWKFKGSQSSCRRCGWGTLPEFWDFCPWCGVAEKRR